MTIFAEEIAGLRVDVAGLETSVHADITALKAGVTLQVNNLRREIATTRASLRGEMTAFKSAVDRRFDTVDRRLTRWTSDSMGSRRRSGSACASFAREGSEELR